MQSPIQSYNFTHIIKHLEEHGYFLSQKEVLEKFYERQTEELKKDISTEIIFLDDENDNLKMFSLKKVYKIFQDMQNLVQIGVIGKLKKLAFELSEIIGENINVSQKSTMNFSKARQLENLLSTLIKNKIPINSSDFTTQKTKIINLFEMVDFESLQNGSGFAFGVLFHEKEVEDVKFFNVIDLTNTLKALKSSLEYLNLQYSGLNIKNEEEKQIFAEEKENFETKINLINSNLIAEKKYTNKKIDDLEIKLKEYRNSWLKSLDLPEEELSIDLSNQTHDEQLSFLTSKTSELIFTRSENTPFISTEKVSEKKVQTDDNNSNIQLDLMNKDFKSQNTLNLAETETNQLNSEQKEATVDYFIKENKNLRNQLLVLNSTLDGIKDSKILTGESLQLIKSQFERPVLIKLIYGSDMHSDTNTDFHQKCDHIGPTFVLIKSGVYVGGGFSDQNWESPEEEIFKASENSFLFSVNRSKIYKIKPEKMKYAICCNKQYGPAFGYGIDLGVESNLDHKMNISNPSSYDFSASSNAQAELFGKIDFCIDYFEVFTVQVLE